MRSFPLIEFRVCLKLLLKSQDSATKLKISFFGFIKSSKVGRDLQYPCVEYGTLVPGEFRLFNVKLKVVDVSLVFFSLELTLRIPREMTTIMGFRRRRKWKILMMDNSVKIWIEIRRGKENVHKYVKKIKLLYVMILH